MEQNFEPIETEVGFIRGRDAIFLDEINFNYQKHTVVFSGEFNNSVWSNRINDDKWIKYSLTFSGVLSFRMIELDFGDFKAKSSFDLVQNSKWIAEMQDFDSASKVKPDHKHYFLQTYDDVFEIVSQQYELKLL